MKKILIVALIILFTVVALKRTSAEEIKNEQKIADPNFIPKEITPDILHKRKHMWNLKQEGVFGTLDSLFYEKKFDELEKIATKFRTEKTRSRGGNWELDFFYKNLSIEWSDFSPAYEQAIFDRFSQWEKEFPDSPTPLILMARTHIDYGWHARGSGYCNTVSDEGWRVFNLRLSKARALLIRAQAKKIKDPDVYSTLIMVSKGLGDFREVAPAMFEKGIEIEKTYCPLYKEMAKGLMLRWYGEKGDLERFAERAVYLTQDQEGISFYSRLAGIAFRYFGHGKYKEFESRYSFPYEKIKGSYMDIIDRFPHTRFYRSEFCLYAYCNNDKEMARKLLKKIGNRPNLSAFGSRKTFEACKRWAFEEK